MEKAVRLNDELVALVRKFQRNEIDILQKLNEMDSFSGWRFYQATSLWDYAMRILKLSREQTGRFISVSRASQAVPEVLGALNQGELTLSHVLGMAPVLKDKSVSREEKLGWVETAKDCTVVELRDQIMDAKPESVAKEGESVRKKSKNLVKISFLVTMEEKEVLDLAKNILRLKKNKDLLMKLSHGVIEKDDPVKKAERAQTREQNKAAKRAAKNAPNKSPPNANPVNETSGCNPTPPATLKTFEILKENPVPESISPEISFKNDKGIPAKSKHAVNLRERGSCSYLDPGTGNRCASRHFAEVHHIIPRSEGGTNDAMNLIILCHAHHQIEHFF